MLYPVKVLSERVVFTLTPSEKAKKAVANSIIDRRIKEIDDAEKSGKQEDIETAIRSFNSTANELKKLDTIYTGHLEDEIEKQSRENSEHETESDREDSESESDDVKGTTTTATSEREGVQDHRKTSTNNYQDSEDRQKSPTPSFVRSFEENNKDPGESVNSDNTKQNSQSDSNDSEDEDHQDSDPDEDHN